MVIYRSQKEAIALLKQHGYTNKFYLFETKLLWMQQKVFIAKEAFQIDESHCFRSGKRKRKDSTMFGITLKNSQVKGILLDGFIKYAAAIPVIIKSKLYEMLQDPGHSC